MRYFIFDKNFYGPDDSTGKGISPEEIFSTSDKDPSVSVTIVDYLPKIIVTSEVSQQIKEDVILKNFDASFMLQDEKIASNTFQAVGIFTDMIKQVHSSFKNGKVVSVIPYGLAIRTFLKSHELLPPKKVVLFMDRLDDRVFLTFFNGMTYTKVSKFVYSDTPDLAGEIKRHLQNFSGAYKKEAADSPEYLFITNSRDIHKLLVSSHLGTPNDCIFIDIPYPAVEGHAFGKFDMHFLLPEDLLRLRKAQELKSFVKYIVLSGALVVAGVIVFLAGFSTHKTNLEKLSDLENRYKNLKEELINKNTHHYRDFFFKKGEGGFAKIIFQFTENVPAQHFIHQYSVLLVDNKHKFEGVITPGMKAIELENFFKDGTFRSSKIEYILLNDRPAQKVILYY